MKEFDSGRPRHKQNRSAPGGLRSGGRRTSLQTTAAVKRWRRRAVSRNFARKSRKSRRTRGAEVRFCPFVPIFPVIPPCLPLSFLTQASHPFSVLPRCKTCNVGHVHGSLPESGCQQLGSREPNVVAEQDFASRASLIIRCCPSARLNSTTNKKNQNCLLKFRVAHQFNVTLHVNETTHVEMKGYGGGGEH